MTDTPKKPLTERGATNFFLSAFLYPYTLIPFTPLMGIYRTGKETLNLVKKTPIGKNETAALVATVLATPILSVPLSAPLGLLQGFEFLSDKIEEFGLDKGLEGTVKRASETVFGTLGKTLDKTSGK